MVEKSNERIKLFFRHAFLFPINIRQCNIQQIFYYFIAIILLLFFTILEINKEIKLLKKTAPKITVYVFISIILIIIGVHVFCGKLVVCRLNLTIQLLSALYLLSVTNQRYSGSFPVSGYKFYRGLMYNRKWKIEIAENLHFVNWCNFFVLKTQILQ